MSHITTEDPATLRLPFKEKLAYGIGDLASNILLDYLFDFKILYCVYRYGYRHYVGFPTQDRSKR